MNINHKALSQASFIVCASFTIGLLIAGFDRMIIAVMTFMTGSALAWFLNRLVQPESSISHRITTLYGGKEMTIYRVDGTSIEGKVSLPDSSKNIPGFVCLHDASSSTPDDSDEEEYKSAPDKGGDGEINDEVYVEEELIGTIIIRNMDRVSK